MRFVYHNTKKSTKEGEPKLALPGVVCCLYCFTVYCSQ